MGLSFRPKGRQLTFGITLSCGVAFALFGYDEGVFGGILSCPAFEEQFDHPSTTIQGQITSSYVLGCVIGAFMAMFGGDRLGRKRSIMLACTFLVIGGILQSTAFTLPHLIVGRIVAGFGVGMNTTTVPMWQSETCKPKDRGKLMSIQVACLVFGFVLANWINFGFTYIPNDPVSWRFPLGFQSFLALVTMAIVPWIVESPRWLCLQGDSIKAKEAIALLLAKPDTDNEVLVALESIEQTVAHEVESEQSSWRTVFEGGPQQTFRRIALGAGANFMQQFGGVNVVAYYLPVVLKRSFGFSDRLALILSAVDSMQWMFWSAMATYVIDRIGRHRLMIYGSAGQCLCFTMAALGLGIGTKAMNGVAVAFIFLYYFFFGLSFLVISFMYPSEINSHHTRNLGSSIAMVTNWLGVCHCFGIESIGWKFYLVFAVTNFVFIPICWYLYVETASLSLEEIDKLFEIKYYGGKSMSYQEATENAKMTLGVADIEHVEKLEN
ncbi:hypothetical protein N7478_001353 [Penicillium angulare]|uniref:uncharacterized protein n=1 Tax=Penicillium angulare TaxID=116970 RepID=UPI0025416E73|nr:uncharacterized protein N7478_001353 [Penicillium angulare]KAJ5292102.1 hypothetical protein N7478_001353 [Penicillium angulare]